MRQKGEVKYVACIVCETIRSAATVYMLESPDAFIRLVASVAKLSAFIKGPKAVRLPVASAIEQVKNNIVFFDGASIRGHIKPIKHGGGDEIEMNMARDVISMAT